MNDGLTPHRGNKTLPDDVPHDSLRELYRGDCLPTPNNVAFAEVHQMVKKHFALFKVPSLAVFSTLMCVGPIYALPLGYVIKGEKVSARAVGGSVLAVVGVIPMFFWDHITA